MTSCWLFLVAVGLMMMAIGCARAGSIEQLEDDIVDETLVGKHLVSNDARRMRNILRNLKEWISRAKREVEREERRRKKKKSGHKSTKASHYGAGLNPTLEKCQREGNIMEKCLRRIVKRYRFSKPDEVKRLFKIEFSNDIKKIIGCPNSAKFPKCDKNSPYRTVNGICNNLKNPFLGSTDTPFVRLIDPDYGDVIGSPRRAKNGKKLPNARKVSFRVFKDQDRPSKTNSHLSMTWGQFLDHDITLGAHPEVECNGPCTVRGTDCFGIPIPKRDSRFRSRGVSCIRVTRDAAACRRECKFGPRQQVNTLTAFIDASMVYGADKVTADRERDLSSDLGLMKETNNPNGHNFLPLLPQNPSDENCSPDAGTKDQCFTSGDVRVNENPGKWKCERALARGNPFLTLQSSLF